MEAFVSGDVGENEFDAEADELLVSGRDISDSVEQVPGVF